MPTYPEGVILEYISTYISDDFNQSPDGNWININSIFTQDNKYRMGFNIPDNFVHDFKMEEAWPFEKFVEIHQDLSSVDARSLLMRIYMKYLKSGLSISKPIRKIVPVIDLNEVKIKPEMKELSDPNVLRNKIGRKAVRYLIHRGFGVEHIKKFRLKYCDQWECYRCGGDGIEDYDESEGSKCSVCKGSGKNPYYGWMIIPSYENGNLVYFQGRNLDQTSDFRYRNPYGLPKSQVVLFYDQLKEGDRIFITEGPTDAMTLLNYSVCCIMGNRMSEPQAQKILRKKPKAIIFIPDWDETREKREIIAKALKKNIRTLRKFGNGNLKIGVYKWYVKYGKQGKDLNDVGLDRIEEDLILMKDFKGEVLEKLNNV